MSSHEDPRPHQVTPEDVGSGGGTEVDIDVLVVGAGPTGLTAAAEALRHGLSVRIVDRKAARDRFSKALVVHARTMAVFEIMGVAQGVRALGAPFAALNLDFGEPESRVRVDLLGQPWGDTAYPYWLSVPQYDTERVLEDHLARLGGEVEWFCAVRDLTDHDDHVEATLTNELGSETLRARWVVGCDGGRSTVRDEVGIDLRRTGERTTFLLADLKSTSSLVQGEGYLYLAHEGLLIIVPMPEPGRWRVIAQVPSDSDGTRPTVDAARLDDLIRERAGIEFGGHDVTWNSQFDLSHGVADRFRSGRVLLAGDAAHIHSPVGGQGLNTGVQDAHNVLWRLAESRRSTPEQAEVVLAAYESERRGAARRMVRGVALMTSLMTSRRWWARRIRRSISPRILSRPAVQARLGRDVGMLNLSYARASGRRGTGWSVGQRLPNPRLRQGGRMFDLLSGNGFTWMVRGDGVPDPSAAHWMGLPVIAVPDSDLVGADTARCDARVVLIRPDRYIAAVGPEPEALRGATRTSR